MSLTKKKIKALDAALNKKMYKLGVAYGKALAKSCKAKSGMDTADVLKTIDRRKKASLDKALNVKLYKLGHSYGKQLRKIVGNKYAQDMATTVAMDILKLNKKSAKDASSAEARLKQARNSFRQMGKTAAGGALAYSGFKALEPFLPTEGDFNNNIISFKKGLEYSQGINPDKFFAAGQNLRNFAVGIGNKIAGVPRNLLQNMQNFREGLSYANATPSPRALMPSVGYFSEGKKLGDAVNKISGAAQKAVQFGGAQAAKFGNSISGMVGGISPKAAELFAKYPKTTGLAAAAALIGAGYGAYKLWDSKGKKKGSK